MAMAYASWRPVSDHGQLGVLGDVAQVLIGAEQAHHDLGWNCTLPTMYWMCRVPVNDPEARRTRYDVTSTSVPDIGNLTAFATLMEEAPYLSALVMDYPSEPVCHFLVAEAWDVPRSQLMNPRIAQPAVSEIRIAIAIVQPHHLLYVRRERGRGAEIIHDRTDEHGSGHSWAAGRIPAALMRLQAAAHQRYVT